MQEPAITKETPTEPGTPEERGHPIRFWVIVLLVAVAASALVVLYQTGTLSQLFRSGGTRIVFIDERAIVQKLTARVTVHTPPRDVEAIAYQFSRVIRKDTAHYLAKGDVVFYSERDARFPPSCNVSQQVYQQVLRKLPKVLH